MSYGIVYHLELTPIHKKEKFMEYFHVGDPKLGFHLYKNAISKDLRTSERLEETIGDSTDQLFKWSEAMVGYNTKMPEYRDCVDLKISPAHWPYLTEQFKEVKAVYDDINNCLTPCLNHYESRYNFKMEFMEAINFVRYQPGQHFSVHSDHGFSYSCTLSSVMYLNDDYEGGELWFPYLDIKFKPEYGDIVLFPSTYIFAHASLKVTSGVKYAAVTMFDYNDVNHKNTSYGSNAPEQKSIDTKDTVIAKGSNDPILKGITK